MRTGTTHFKDEKNTSYEVGTENSASDIMNDRKTVFGGFEVHIHDENVAPDPNGGRPHDYVTYPRAFITYRWFRPILVALVMTIFLVLLTLILFKVVAPFTADGGASIREMADAGYDDIDIYTPINAIALLGATALMLPALWIANKIAGRRTFRSYESSRGGWDFGIFFSLMGVGILVVVIPLLAVAIFLDGRTGDTRLAVAGIIALLIVGPLQCIAEEYTFRGLLMQTLGSWFRIPAIAIVLQAALFAAVHPYNMIGRAEIFVSGLVFGIVAWASRGIEASSALHVCNNLTIFLYTGFGYSSISSEVDIRGLIITCCTYGAFMLVVLLLRSRGTFDFVKVDDAAEYNEKAAAKIAAKKAKKEAKAAKKAARG